MSDIDDGSDKPLGYQTPDGELEVRDYVDNAGVAGRGYVETDLGAHMRYMRSAPELLERYHAVLAINADLLAACKEFVRKCECGEARSVRSYAQMKAAIAKAEAHS